MATEAKFTHISVSADDDDDFVIQAGASPSAAREGGKAPKPVWTDVAPEAAKSVEAACAASASEPALAADADAAAAGESAMPPESVPSASAAKPASAKKAKAGYQATTLEDLEGQKMSAMQKGVIAAAVVAIIAFVVWYVAF